MCTLAKLRPWCVDWPSDYGSDEWISDLINDEEEFEGILFLEGNLRLLSQISNLRQKLKILHPRNEFGRGRFLLNTLIGEGDVSLDQVLPIDITQIQLHTKKRVITRWLTTCR